MFWCASSSGPGTGIESIGVRFSHCPAVGIKTDTLYGIGQNIVLAMQCLHKLAPCFLFGTRTLLTCVRHASVFAGQADVVLLGGDNLLVF